MIMPSRTFSSEKYLFGFNGKENDNEVKGNGDQQDYGMRIYDPRLGRFLSVDPITTKYPELTPYQFASNNPIMNIDVDGLEGTATVDKKEHKIVVTQTIFYWEKNGNDITTDSKTVDAIKSDPTQGGWEHTFKNINISVNSNEKSLWTITYKTDFIGIKAPSPESYEGIAKQKVRIDQNAIYLMVGKQYTGDYLPEPKCIRLNPVPIGDRKWPIPNSFAHEKGESIGVVHDSRNPYSDLFGKSEDVPEGGIMSNAKHREIKVYEVKLNVINILNVANQVKDNNVRVQLSHYTKATNYKLVK